MKIICLISSLRLGGAERQMALLSSVLHANGHDVTVMTYRDGDFYEELLQRNGIRHIRIREKGDLAIVRKISSFAAKDGTQALVSFMTGANLKACLVKFRLPGLKLIVSERNCNLHLHAHDILRFFAFRKAADAVVCNSFAQNDFIVRHFPALAGKTSVIPNFVESSQFGKSGTGESPGTVPGRRKIIVAARVCRRKNTLGLIRAAALLKRKGLDFRIDWYGLEGSGRYVRTCLRELEHSGLEGNFFIHPKEKEIQRRYAESDIFCLPSFYEGTSNSLAEALSCGLPAACSAVSDTPLYVRDRVNGRLFNPWDVEDMATALGDLVRSDNLDEMGAWSRKTALENFSRTRFADSWLKLFGS